MPIVTYRFFNYEKRLAHGGERSIVRELIKRRSKPRTHMELETETRGLSFSSTNEDAVRGCRLKRINYVDKPWWDNFPFEVSDSEMDFIWEHIHYINGKKYDLVGLLSHATKWNIIRPHRDRYWCNEAGLWVTSPVIYKGETEITPEKAYWAIKKLYDKKMRAV